MDATTIDWRRADPVVVFDLEYTAWEGAMARRWTGPGEHREVIQIGAVLLAGPELAEAAALDLLVKPAVNPVLSDFIIAFTGITNEAVAADGLDLAAALDRLAAFAGPAAPLLSNGDDGDVIAESCGLQGIVVPLARDRFVDMHGAIARALGRPPDTFVSAGLPEILGLASTGRAHTGLADARAIAAALRHLRAHGRL